MNPLRLGFVIILGAAAPSGVWAQAPVAAPAAEKPAAPELADFPAGIVRAAVMRLSAYHYRIDRASWELLTPAAPRLLMALVSDENQAGDIRAKALSTLGGFPGPEPAGFLEAYARDEARPELVRRRALDALVRAAPARAEAALAAAMANPSPILREAAYRHLAALRPAALAENLRRAAGAETDPHLKALARAAMPLPAP